MEIRDLRLNPALSECFSDSSFGLKYSSKNYEFLVKSMYFLHENKFINWIENKFSRNYSRSVLAVWRKALKFEINSVLDFKNLIGKKIGEKYGSVSFRVWLNFLEEFELLPEEIIEKSRKKIKLIKKTNVDSYIPTKIEIKESLNNINPPHLTLYSLFLESGCRYTEFEKLVLEFDIKKVEFCGEIAIRHYLAKKRLF
ncbi:MAG: hypothetical protein ACOCXG_04875 [Nanoarchaeota archaeon]